jgi:integrase
VARLTHRLNARSVDTITKAGLHADGGGLYLSTTGGGRRWVFVFRWQGKRREMGLGSASDVPLSRARQLAADARTHVAEGRDPIALREAQRDAALKADAKAVITFGAFAESYIASVEAGWRNEVHRKQWRNSLRDHACALRDQPIAEVATADVLAVLQPIWLTKSETASRVRGRIEKILSAAKARGLRPQDAANPAAWRGHLDVLLPRRLRLTRGHHPAMPYVDLPNFMRELRARTATAARALEFLILNASRTSEVLGARWSEVSGDTWTVPATRMKAGAAHTVVLSPPAMAILDGIKRQSEDDYIFSGASSSRPLSNMAMDMLLRRMGHSQYTVHGFRSSFKDWALNCTEYPDELSEEYLAHTVGSRVRRAYRRSEALDRRRSLAADWGGFISSQQGDSQLENCSHT